MPNSTSRAGASRPSAPETHLYLTNNRSFQQANTLLAKLAKQRLRGKRFKIKKQKPTFCKSSKMALIKVAKNQIVEYRLVYIPCDSWTCPECSLKKALKVKYMFRDVIRLNNLFYFLTLTLDPQKIPPEYKDNTHRYITKIFNHFVTILKRTKEIKKSSKLKYVWVIEFQKNGNAHMHILLNKFLNIRTVRELWTHVGGGLQMNIQKIKTLEGISNYISDYIVKGIKGDIEEKMYGFKYFERRYSISKSCIRPEKALYSKLTLKQQMTDLKDVDFEEIYNELNKT